MRKFLLALLVANVCWGSPRTVTGPLQNPSNSGASGTVRVEWQTFTAGDGSLIVAGSRTTTVTSGTYSQTFEPTQDAAPSGVTYKVTYRFGSASPSVCYWSIPAGSGSVLIADIQTCSPPSAPAGTIALSQLSIGGGSNGQCAIISSGVWAPGSCTASWTVNGNDIYNSNTANVGIGGTPGNYKLDVSKSGSTATMRLFDQTAVTGDTQFDIRLGAGQGAYVIRVADNADADLAVLNSSGNWLGTAFIIGSSFGLFGGGPQYYNNAITAWSSTSNYTGTKDIGLDRDSAGVLAVMDGNTSNAYRDMKFRNLTLTGLSGSGTKYVCVDNSGNLSVGSSC